MKRITLFFLLFALAKLVSAQQVLQYNFENSLNEANGDGPALTVLGTEGVFVLDTLNEISGSTKTVYRFEKNNGLQFNNIAASGFIGDSYTIELYFVFDELASWKRVVDWKNRKTDWGAYVYYGKLNFYNILYSNEAPVLPGEYTYYVITRNANDDDKVLIYTDAEVKIEFTDGSGAALIDADGMLNFFYDDVVVPNEASSGAVAMVKLYNYPLTQENITNNWNGLGSQVFGIHSLQTRVQMMVYPNPAAAKLNVNLTSFSQNSRLTATLYNSQGNPVYFNDNFYGGGVESIPVSIYPAGMYFLQVSGENEKASSTVVIR